MHPAASSGKDVHFLTLHVPRHWQRGKCPLCPAPPPGLCFLPAPRRLPMQQAPTPLAPRGSPPRPPSARAAQEDLGPRRPGAAPSLLHRHPRRPQRPPSRSSCPICCPHRSLTGASPGAASPNPLATHAKETLRILSSPKMAPLPKSSRSRAACSGSPTAEALFNIMGTSRPLISLLSHRQSPRITTPFPCLSLSTSV